MAPLTAKPRLTELLLLRCVESVVMVPKGRIPMMPSKRLWMVLAVAGGIAAIVIWRGTDGGARRTARSMAGQSVTTAWSPTRAVEPADGHVAQRHVRRTAAVGLRVQDTSGLPALLIALASRLGGYPEALAVMPSGEAERARVT